MLDNIRKFLTIYTLLLDNILTFLRILLQLRKERAEITPWTILNNIRQYLTILYNIEQNWTIFGKILRYLTISRNIVCHLIPQNQTYAIPKFSVPFLFLTWASSRGAFASKNAPQFLLNFSGYKHARRLRHNPLERWDPWLCLEYKNLYVQYLGAEIKSN